MADPKRSLVERLFAEHRAALQVFFRQRIRRQADAPDLTQEVYLRILRVSDKETIRDPARYLYAVASNLAKEHALLELRQASGVDVDEGSIQEQLATLPAFDGELDSMQRVVMLRSVLRQLSPTCRAVVTLHYTHGRSCREIATQLGISHRMARKYVAQALGHCRRRMARLG